MVRTLSAGRTLRSGGGIGSGRSLSASRSLASSSLLRDGLISYWTLEEASGTRADSVGRNNLTDNNTVTQNPGKIGNAAQFTIANSEYLSVADNPSFSSITNKMSIAGWLYMDAIGLSQALATKWAYQTDGEWVIALNTSNKIICNVATSAADSGSTAGTSSSALGNVSTWYHWAVVFDGTQTGNSNRLKMYVNGVAETPTYAGTIPATIRDGAAQFRLGAWSGTLTRYWGGRLDEVGLWSKALTPVDVATLYNGGNGLGYPF